MNLSNINDDEKNIDNSICDLSNELVSLKNPTKIHEIIVKIVNLILTVPFYISIFLVSLLLFLTLFVGIISSKSSDSTFIDIFKSGMFEILLFSGISLLVTIIFNVLMGILMYKKNKNISYKGKFKKIKKVSYLLWTLFFGAFGTHRFIIGDKKGGIIRLAILFVIPLIFLPILNIIFGNSFANGITLTAIVIFVCVLTDYSISSFILGFLLNKKIIIFDNNLYITIPLLSQYIIQ